jgi:hypothetical protein
MTQFQNLLPLLFFFLCVYLFFRWVVHDMNRPSDR